MNFRGKRVKWFFTSDTHMGHGNIIKYSNRPFWNEEEGKIFEQNGNSWNGVSHKISYESIAKMDSVLIDSINRVVGEDDVLWHLGDFALPGKYDYFEKCQAYRDRIICKNVFMILGNHDQQCIERLFSRTYGYISRDERVYSTVIKEFNSYRIAMSHFAPAIWDKSHRGVMFLYGHSHSSAEEWLDKALPGRRAFDVGVDNAYKLLGEYRPFSLEEVVSILKNRNGCEIDHHAHE